MAAMMAASMASSLPSTIASSWLTAAHVASPSSPNASACRQAFSQPLSLRNVLPLLANSRNSPCQSSPLLPLQFFALPSFLCLLRSLLLLHPSLSPHALLAFFSSLSASHGPRPC